MHFFRLAEAVDPKAYPDLDAFWTDLIAVYRAELAALDKLGCKFVQFDEVPIAMLCDPKIRRQTAANGVDAMKLLDKYIEVFNEVAKGKPAGMTITMHLCKGNYKGHWMAEGDYEAISERLFNGANVDTFFLEYDSERAGGFEPLRNVPKSKNVVLGLISSKTPQMESVDALRKRVDDATRYISLEQLGVSPQCGFASSVGGNPLTIDDERRKLALVVELARKIWN
jgi:5-methyltetrahydropteroyltriglutamate--homocysteine methyltransferase